jgi:hypothetical protein
MSDRLRLRIECFCLFVLWPAAALFLEGMSKFAIFAAPLAYAIAVYMRARPARPPATWPWRIPAIRLLIAIPILIALTRLLAPDWWLAFPRERPGLWALVMAAYPFLSAWPQEFLYRRFFFWRYAPLFGEGAARTAINAILFGWLHAMYDNWPAVALSALGGVFFATTYARSRNLALVWIEHALYGQLLFTFGLGRFFYEGPT